MVRIRKTGKSRAVRKNTAKNKARPEEEALAPHSFVINNKLVTADVYTLTSDFRRLMRPNTASSLQVSRRNRVRDFVPLASHFHVSHLCYFTNTESGTYFKLCRLPRGPTLTFRVDNFTLTKDVVTQKKKQLVWEKFYEHSPLVILNGMSGEGMHFKLMANMFQNMFPTINLLKVNLNNIRRCLLFNYDAKTDLIDVRHYAITIKPTGVSKAVKKLMKQKVPDLSRFQDISEFFLKSEVLSDSEVEDDPNSIVTVPQKLISRGNEVAKKSAVRLVEMGPRLTLQLIKVQDNLLSGEILYHKIVSKSPADILKTKKKLNARRKLKEKRKREQELNVKAKEAEKEENKKRSLAGMEKNKTDSGEAEPSVKKRRPNEDDVDADTEHSEDDDAEWYRQEIGEEPESDLFQKSDRSKSKKPMLSKGWRNRQRKPKTTKSGQGEKDDAGSSADKRDRKGKTHFKSDKSDKGNRKGKTNFKANRLNHGKQGGKKGFKSSSNKTSFGSGKKKFQGQRKKQGGSSRGRNRH